MGEGIKITMESLYDLLRREREEGELIRLDSNHYNEVMEYLATKKSLIADKDSVFSADNEELNAEIKTIKRFIREIFEKREKKIIEMATNTVRTGVNMIDRNRMLSHEYEFFVKVIKFCKDRRESILIPCLEVKPKTNDITQQQTESAEKTTEGEIMFVKDVPRFVGTDLNYYGPFTKGQKAELPEDVVSMLKNKALIE